MTVSPTSFRSISNVTDWLVRFNIVLIIITLISLAATIYLTFSTEYSLFLSILAAMGVLSTIISFVEFIIRLFWYYRATKNIHSFGAQAVISPTMAVVWWFIPIFFFWKPYNVTQQIWKASNPEINLTEGVEWKKSPSSKTIKQWWSLYLIAIAGGVLVAVVGISFGTEYTMESEELGVPLGSTFDLLAIPFQSIGIISIVLFVRIIRQLSTWQEVKSGRSV